MIIHALQISILEKEEEKVICSEGRGKGEGVSPATPTPPRKQRGCRAEIDTLKAIFQKQEDPECGPTNDDMYEHAGELAMFMNHIGNTE